MKQLTEKEALSKLMAVCARGEHCCQEMREKMMRWGIDSSAQQRIIDQLTDRQFIDEERFTRMFVSDKLRFNKWGRRKIELALYRKRIPKNILKPILDAITTEEYAEQLRPLIDSKRRSLPADDSDYICRQKLVRYALGRGFTFDIIHMVIDDADDTGIEESDIPIGDDE